MHILCSLLVTWEKGLWGRVIVFVKRELVCKVVIDRVCIWNCEHQNKEGLVKKKKRSIPWCNTSFLFWCLEFSTLAKSFSCHHDWSHFPNMFCFILLHTYSMVYQVEKWRIFPYLYKSWHYGNLSYRACLPCFPTPILNGELPHTRTNFLRLVEVILHEVVVITGKWFSYKLSMLRFNKYSAYASL